MAAERRGLELTPQLPLARTLLVNALTLGGDPATALAECATLTVVEETLDLARCLPGGRHQGGQTRRGGTLAHADGAAQANARSRAGPADAALGAYPEAFARLDRLAAAGNLPPNLGFDPLFEGLRNQPQWKGVANRLASQSSSK